MSNRWPCGFWEDNDRTFRNSSPSVRGLPLRCLLVEVLRQADGALTVADLVRALANDGVVFEGRASKIVSDALRWEVRRGRVGRLRRGVYAFRGAPRTTMARIRRRAAATRRFLRPVVEVDAPSLFLEILRKADPPVVPRPI